jgi:hypothetical protein
VLTLYNLLLEESFSKIEVDEVVTFKKLVLPKTVFEVNKFGVAIFNP